MYSPVQTSLTYFVRYLEGNFPSIVFQMNTHFLAHLNCFEYIVLNVFIYIVLRNKTIKEDGCVVEELSSFIVLFNYKFKLN